MKNKLNDIWYKFYDWYEQKYWDVVFFDWKTLKIASYEIISGRFTLWDHAVWEYLLADHPSFSVLLCRIAGHPHTTYHKGYDPPDETPYCIGCGDESWGYHREPEWWKRLTPHG